MKTMAYYQGKYSENISTWPRKYILRAEIYLVTPNIMLLFPIALLVPRIYI
jgi:hypothetical protein